MLFVPIKRGVLIVLLFLGYLSCNVQEKTDPPKDKSVKEITKIEVAPIQNDIVRRISDPNKVAEIKERLLMLRKEREAKRLAALQNKPITERFKFGDTTVVDSLINFLRQSEASVANESLKKLQNKHNAPSAYSITNPELIKVILEKFHDEATAFEAMQLCGIMRIPSTLKVLEKSFLEGKFSHPIRLFYWLGIMGADDKSLDKIRPKIAAKKIQKEQLMNLVGALKAFAASEDSTVANKALDLAFLIYNKNLINPNDFQQLGNAENSKDPASLLLDIFYSHGEIKALSVASKMMQMGVQEKRSLLHFVKYKKEQSKDQVKKYLKDSAKFDFAVQPIFNLYDNTKDSSLIQDLLIQLETHNYLQPERTDPVVEGIVERKLDQFAMDSDSLLKNEAFKSDLVFLYDLKKKNAREVAKVMQELGVVNTPFSKTQIEKGNEIFRYYGEQAFLYNFLSVSGIYLDINPITAQSPLDYHLIVDLFVKNSSGLLADALVGIESRSTQHDYAYEITVIINNHAYLAAPNSDGNIYDFETVTTLINQIILDLGKEEKFNLLSQINGNFQYLFCKPSALEALVSHYSIEKKEKPDRYYLNENSI